VDELAQPNHATESANPSCSAWLLEADREEELRGVKLSTWTDLHEIRPAGHGRCRGHRRQAATTRLHLPRPKRGRRRRAATKDGGEGDEERKAKGGGPQSKMSGWTPTEKAGLEARPLKHEPPRTFVNKAPQEKHTPADEAPPPQ
jgi:hypothetical protein